MSMQDEKALEALRLYDIYDKMPSDRGGKNGPRGRAYQAFVDAKEAALSPAQPPVGAASPQAEDRRCRECGITRIEPGTEVDGWPLCWADDDLCSRCQDRLREEMEQDAARYRYLRNRRTRPADYAAGGVFAGRTPDNVILGGEGLDRAIDAELGVKPVGETLEARLAECLADIIDTPLLNDFLRNGEGLSDQLLDLRVGSFLPHLSERAAELLEEAGRW